MTIKTAWEEIQLTLAKSGCAPNLWIFDNECSKELKVALLKYDLDFQRVPPHIHRQNAAERAIRTFNNHMLASLATCDPDFPIAEWDRVLFQIGLTLNMLRCSRVNPKLSTWAYLYGNYDFNKNPLAPIGTQVLIHLKADVRASWQNHG